MTEQPVNFEERRRHPRIEMRRFGKIYDHRTRKYLPCTTCNVSGGGAFVEVARPLPYQAGDRILIGLPAAGQAALLRARDLVEVEVLRALVTTDRRQGLALRFFEADDATEGVALRLAA